jgi:hypothetical protein
MSAAGVKNPSLPSRRITPSLLEHLKKDHPVEGAIAEKMIASGEWTLEDADGEKE